MCATYSIFQRSHCGMIVINHYHKQHSWWPQGTVKTYEKELSFFISFYGTRAGQRPRKWWGLWSHMPHCAGLKHSGWMLAGLSSYRVTPPRLRSCAYFPPGEQELQREETRARIVFSRTGDSKLVPLQLFALRVFILRLFKLVIVILFYYYFQSFICYPHARLLCTCTAGLQMCNICQ